MGAGLVADAPGAKVAIDAKGAAVVSDAEGVARVAADAKGGIAPGAGVVGSSGGSSVNSEETSAAANGFSEAAGAGGVDAVEADDDERLKPGGGAATASGSSIKSRGRSANGSSAPGADMPVKPLGALPTSLVAPGRFERLPLGPAASALAILRVPVVASAAAAPAGGIEGVPFGEAMGLIVPVAALPEIGGAVDRAAVAF
jgi:hypothetical protein